MDETIYVYDGVEVKLTSRKATKQVETTSRRTKETNTKQQELVEITPVNATSLSWKKWVKMEELFTIIEDKNESQT